MTDLRTQTLSIETTDDIENNSGYSAFLSHQLITNAENDYLAMRLLLPYGSILHTKIAHNAAECLEKILKAFLLKRNIKKTEEIEKYVHDLERIRNDCAEVDIFFKDTTLESFCNNYSRPKRGNNVLRYGFAKNTKSYGVNIENIIQMTDKFFLGTFMKMEDNNFFMSNSKIASLFYPTISQKGLVDNFNPEIISNMKYLISNKNGHLNAFIKIVENFYIELNQNSQSG